METFPPSLQGPAAPQSASKPQDEVWTTHLALSLKEMSEIPGGAFRTFWEPEYKTSMPRLGTERGMAGIPQRNVPNRCVCPCQTVCCDWRTKISLRCGNQEVYGRARVSDLSTVSSYL